MKRKQCPFCKSADTFVERADFSSCYVVCNDCGAKGPPSCDENEADCRASESGRCDPGERAAVRLWNARRRAALPSALSGDAGEVEALHEAETWLRAISSWLLANDHDMTLPSGILDTDPLDIADRLAEVAKGKSDAP